MGIQFEDLPEWEFTVVEQSAGIYQITAVRNGGIHGDSTGSDFDGLMEDLKAWARKTERDLAARRRT